MLVRALWNGFTYRGLGSVVIPAAQEGDFLVLPEEADVSVLQPAVDGLRANQAAKSDQEAAKRKEEQEQTRARAMAKRRAEEAPLGKVAQAKAA